jgi:hypothetical protein
MVAMPAPALAQTECDDWQTLHPDWIFSDGFESSDTKAWSTSVQ